MIKISRKTAGSWVAVAVSLGVAASLPSQETATETVEEQRVELGSRLFVELNFSNQAADYGSSCSGCHATGDELEGRGQRRHADYTARSMTPLKQLTSRNTPTLLDVGSMPLLGWSGDYDSLEQLVLDKMLGSAYGWKPTDRERASAAIQFTLLEEGAGGGLNRLPYAKHFQEAYDVDLSALEAEATVELGARAIADYVRSLTSTGTAPWDAFVGQNRLRKGPNEGETAENYSAGVFSRIGNQEGRRLIKRPKGFSQAAYQGFKTFFRMTAQEGQSAGRCIVCHVPPRFTDDAFHNSGIAEAAYDALHGDGSAARLAPEEPSVATASPPNADDPTLIDLGRWNVAPDEGGSRGAFKTPTLRNLGGSDPYMHNGAYASLEDAVRAKIEISRKARAGEAPWVDPAYRGMVLTDSDIESLVAFLQQLGEVGRENFRQYLIELADD